MLILMFLKILYFGNFFIVNHQKIKSMNKIFAFSYFKLKYYIQCSFLIKLPKVYV